jgi:eukaryotic-like serine/threonine-protein kinase
MAAVADSNFLFGLLALQTGMIDQAALMAAFHAWTQDKARSIAEILLGQGVIDAGDREALEALAAKHVMRHGGDVEKSLAAVPVPRSIVTELASIETTEATADAFLSPLADAPGVTVRGDGNPDSHARMSMGGAVGNGQRFRILRPHARGGLGAVFVAIDAELNREVALKQILDQHADNSISRSRFLVEAQITGGLEHPGIVPVYGLGHDGDGRPYYAMRFIRGDSLKEAIDRFHQRENTQSLSPLVGEGQHGGAVRAPTGSRDLELRKLLSRFLDVCNAIDYAHSRGVIHRDIKPANIIVGNHGETLVVDWGLAKPIGRVEPGTESVERLLTPSSMGGSAVTIPGSTLGTPAYMSPEQADGRLDRLGPWSDVYSLGATLYCLLTGRPPYEGDAVRAVLGAVQKGEFARPRKLDPSIDKALEAVCLKAMALKPEDRYGTPRALADDIEHWLADEPVKAYPERRLERLGRWLRQHRTWTYAAVTSLIGITLAATVAATLIEGGRRREERARKEAETNFVMAQDAVKDYLTSVSENMLLKQQDSVDLRGLRQELLNTALKYYKNFVNQRYNDPNLRQQLANAYFRVGQITQEIDSHVEAIEAFHSAQTIWEALAAADPENKEFPGHLTDCHLAIGEQKSSLGDLQGALASFNQALAVIEPLAPRHRDLALDQQRLADCYSAIGIVQGRLHSGDQGLDNIEKARSIQQALLARFPAEMKYRKRLAEIMNYQGFVYFQRLDYDNANRCFVEGQEICQSILDRVGTGPKPVSTLNFLALSHYNIATIHMEKGQFDRALEALEKSLEYRSELVAAHPSVTRFRESLGETHEVIAGIQHRAHQDDKAFASLRMSIEILDKLVQSHPEQARHHRSMGRSWNALGFFHDELRHNLEAIPAFEKAVKEQEQAVALAPDDNEYKVLLGNHLENLGEQYVDLGQVDRGLPYYKQGIQIRRQLFTAHPEKRAYRLELTEALSRLGTIQRHAGDATAARATFLDGRSLLERAAAASPGDQGLPVSLGAALLREALALADLREPEQARSSLERSVKTLSDASVSSTEVDQRREWRSEALWELARILRVLKNTAEAERVDALRVALWQDRPPAELADLALKETSRAASIGYGKTPVPSVALAVRELDLDQAASNLRLAIARGFRDLPALESHPDSHLLFSRADVQLLIMDMAFPDRPFGDP